MTNPVQCFQLIVKLLIQLNANIFFNVIYKMDEGSRAAQEKHTGSAGSVFFFLFLELNFTIEQISHRTCVDGVELVAHDFSVAGELQVDENVEPGSRISRQDINRHVGETFG